MTVNYGTGSAGSSRRRSIAKPVCPPNLDVGGDIVSAPPKRSIAQPKNVGTKAKLTNGAEVYLGEDLVAVPQPGSDIPKIELTDVVTPGKYNEVEVDRKGRVVRGWKTTSSGGADGSYATESFIVDDPSVMIYALSYQPLSNTAQLHINGLQNFEGVDDDFSIESNLIIFQPGTPLSVGDRIKVTYQY
jgi:hypothetical protein